MAGAWFGGNIETTAAVVGAGTIHGEEAQAVATVVKMAQNVFIGVAAFLLALYFVIVVERKPGERPGAAVIWQRFPLTPADLPGTARPVSRLGTGFILVHFRDTELYGVQHLADPADQPRL